MAATAFVLLLGAATRHASAAPTTAMLPAPPHALGIPGNAALLQVEVRSSLERALYAGDPTEGRALAAEVARLLRWQGNPARLVRPGDHLDVLYARRPGPTEPELLALHYRGERMQLEAYRFAATGDHVARYYDGNGHRVEPKMRNPPVPHYWQITETVQHGRGRRRHKGDDFRAPEGSAVVLPFAGRITRINWARRHNGRCIEVLLDAGYLAHFLHLQTLAPHVRPGNVLPAGSPLGTVGNTGRSTGAHLHYELLRKHQPVEPLKVHGHVQEVLHGQDLVTFVPLRDALRRQLGGPRGP